MGPNDACTKTGRPVHEVLAEKHPALRMPDPDGDAAAIFCQTEDPPDIVPADIGAETVAKIALKLHGSAGPGGTDAVDLRNWLL